MSNFYVFRHGETFVSKNRLPSYGNTIHTAGILPEAIPVIKRLGSYLKDIKTDLNLTSPFKRCLQTVEIVREITKKEFKKDVRLAEYSEEQENIAGMEKRLKNFLEEFNDKFENILICSHGYPISGLLQLLSEGKIAIEKLNNYPDPGVLLIFKNGKITTVDFNELGY